MVSTSLAGAGAASRRAPRDGAGQAGHAQSDQGDLQEAERLWDSRMQDPEHFGSQVRYLPASPVRDVLEAKDRLRLEQFDRALALVTTAIESLEPGLWLARALDTQSLILTEVGLVQDAVRVNAAADEVYREFEDPIGLIGCLQNLAYIEASGPQRSIEIYEGALELATRTGRTDLMGLIHLNLAVTTADMEGSFEAQIRHLVRAEELLEASWPLAHVHARAMQAGLLLRSGLVKEAREKVAALPDPLSVYDRYTAIDIAVVQAELDVADGDLDMARIRLDFATTRASLGRQGTVLERLAEIAAMQGDDISEEFYLRKSRELQQERSKSRAAMVARAHDIWHQAATHVEAPPQVI